MTRPAIILTAVLLAASIAGPARLDAQDAGGVPRGMSFAVVSDVHTEGSLTPARAEELFAANSPSLGRCRSHLTPSAGASVFTLQLNIDVAGHVVESSVTLPAQPLPPAVVQCIVAAARTWTAGALRSASIARFRVALGPTVRPPAARLGPAGP